ncbi:hypothetical protein SOV_43210 [Sporomusa ovata DSM 2662]|uniref:DUF1700 domain-containing protein n=1 Tax=Sporomusa ovata TaxID=2378 RepID=A0A0U1KV74_9FIRM|nr:DUF1700 domain-containing protein [Sporomusa ovata]EQB26709.1 hypothetical protein SOV_3c05830 [Sporomusa ovata DSM 2662]CQR70803.1 hypothetical protein SpAn4DRAFT_1781 [Sporomusa ovata]
MTKQDFLGKLEMALKNIPAQERQDILYDYEEHFISGVANGKSESEIATALGNPEAIAKEILADYHVTQAVENISITTIVRAVLATVSLGFLNLVFILGPLIGVVGVLVACYVVAIVLILIPALLPLRAGFPSGLGAILSWLFTSMMTVGTGTLLGLGMLLVTRWAGKVFIKYLQFNVQIIRGK